MVALWTEIIRKNNLGRESSRSTPRSRRMDSLKDSPSIRNLHWNKMRKSEKYHQCPGPGKRWVRGNDDHEFKQKVIKY